MYFINFILTLSNILLIHNLKKFTIVFIYCIFKFLFKFLR
uniref:Uncharacterized protein n=1 Tax=Kapraunia schneideri TaxID=717899 RepID=A0A1Z1MSK5_9FLOR|nr:hypothetical protein [Kapraunia schneideri]ARW68936.1 hypothetical protein [Kapraunia schneideri]